MAVDDERRNCAFSPPNFTHVVPPKLDPVMRTVVPRRPALGEKIRMVGGTTTLRLAPPPLDAVGCGLGCGVMLPWPIVTGPTLYGVPAMLSETNTEPVGT